MLRRRTVLVLGAGSSVEFNLPAGEGLAKSIAQKTYFWFDESGIIQTGDFDLYRLLRNRFPEHNSVLLAGRRIGEGLLLSRSIDDYLYNHGHDAVVLGVGKASIVHSILEAESNSTLMDFGIREPGASARALEKHSETWIQKLFSFLQTGIRRGDVHRIFDGISIINFNYDRCVETYFYHALQLAYGIGPEEAADVISTLDITHPYGQVGKLPWQNPASGIGFGELPRDDRLLRLADEIKTFTEQAHDDSEKEHWRDVIGSCEQIVFLGFGFHQQNVDLISLENNLEKYPDVYATVYKTSYEDRNVFHRRLKRLFLSANYAERSERGDKEFLDYKCSRMIGELGLMLFS
jgi:hypothetical protein